MRKIMIVMTTLLTLAGFNSQVVVYAAPADFKYSGELKDAWITGKVETVLLMNTHLNNFAINTDVKDGNVHLTGNVKTAVQKDLALELTRGITGVNKVTNDLQIVDEDQELATQAGDDAKRKSFVAWVDDATTTASVKTKLLGNTNTKGLMIDVDTNDDVVTLSGSVETEAAKELAESIARNTGDVKRVENKLLVSNN